jgi:hypothetical protein
MLEFAARGQMAVETAAGDMFEPDGRISFDLYCQHGF